MITTHIHGPVLEILIGNPPVNALGTKVRQGLLEALTSAQADDGIRAVVIRGEGKLFSAGADISEFGQPDTEPSLPHLIDMIEASLKPVVAAIHGMALGGGLEVALGCHYRVASLQSRLGLPEVKLGLLPGAGGTQRLPRLIGVETALAMIVSGDPISASKAHALGLVDRIVDEKDLAQEAIAYAGALEDVRRSGDLIVQADEGVFDRFIAENARKFKGFDAPLACIEAVRAAVDLTFAEGLVTESAAFAELVASEQSRALRHAFFAERAASKIEGLPASTQLRPINKVGVIGAGTMGGGIAMCFLSAGLPVTIVETSQEALDRGAQIVRQNYDVMAAKGRLRTEDVETAIGLLRPTLEFDDLGDCDLIIEAVYENMDVKKEIFARLDRTAKPGALLASNTSFLNIDEIALATRRPQDVLGLHFFSPANVMKLVEVVRGAKSAPDAVVTAMDVARRIGKVAVISGVCHGFIGNRMLLPRQANATSLLFEGATVNQIDRVHSDFGMPMGPFQMADLAGVDIGWHRDPERIESLQDALCTRGRWGQKAKAGFYDYDANRKPSPSPIVASIVEEFRNRAGIKAREITDEEITVRTLYTMINEGAKILEEGIAQRASDIDVVWLYGYGWPRRTGGLMFWADSIGLPAIVKGLESFSDRLGADFNIAPLLRARAASGGKLDR